jgi:hypothetical protein
MRKRWNPPLLEQAAWTGTYTPQPETQHLARAKKADPAADDQADDQAEPTADDAQAEDAQDADPVPAQRPDRSKPQGAQRAKPVDADEPEEAAPVRKARTSTDDAEIVETIDYAELERLRADAAARTTLDVQIKDIQKQLRDAQKRLKEVDDAKLTDEEKRKQALDESLKELSTLRANLMQERLERAIEASAKDANVSPALAARLLKADEVEWDESGKPTNVAKLIKAIVTDNPELVRRPQTQPTNPDRNKRKGPLTVDQVNAMSEDEINERWGEVQDVLTGS